MSDELESTPAELSLEELGELFRPTEADFKRVLAKVAGRRSADEVAAEMGIDPELVTSLREIARQRRSATAVTGASPEARALVERLMRDPKLATELIAASRIWFPK